MSKRSEEIDKLVLKLESKLTKEDGLILFMFDGLLNESMGILAAEDKGNLVSAMCACMESGEKIGCDLIDLVSSIVIGFAKIHPEYATQFIQCFNREIYGTDLDFKV
jgi:hypothetical protein